MRITREEFDLKLRKRLGALDTKHDKQLTKLKQKQADERAEARLDVKFKTMYALGEKLIKQAGIEISNGILQAGLSGMVRPAYGKAFDQHPWQLELYYSGGLVPQPQTSPTIQTFVGREPSKAEEAGAIAEGMARLESVLEDEGVAFTRKRREDKDHVFALLVRLDKLIDA